MASGSDTAKFTLKLGNDISEEAKKASNDLDALRQRVQQGQNALRDYASSLRNLRGSTDDVKAARDKLKKAMDAEREAMTRATVQMLKQGSSVEKLAAQEKKLAEQKTKAEAADKKVASTANRLLGPLGSLREKLADVREMFSGGSTSANLFKLGVAGVVAVALAATAAIAASVVALGKFVLRGADAARSASLFREAMMNGNAQWGKNFGEQVEALARKVPTGRAEIQALGAELAKSRIGGQVWVDTLNAVTQASAALGDDAGSKLKEFITRGRQLGRMQINPLEMIGTGVDFDDVAKALAESMHVGVKDARAALFEGRVKLGDGATALRDAVEKKVGGINLRQMMSLDNLVKKLGESFDRLTKDVNLEPVLKAFKELADVFDTNTVSGQALKQIVEVFGKEFGKTITGSTPIAKKFIYGMIIGAQQLVISYLQLRNTLRNTFGDSKVLKNVDVLGAALTLGKGAAVGMAVAVAAVGIAVGAAFAPFVYVGGLVTKFFAQLSDLTTQAMSYDWSGLGKSIVDGIVNGLTRGYDRIKEAVKGLGKLVPKTFREVLDMHSPSRVMFADGKNIAKGAEQGVDAGAPGVQSAVDRMAPEPRISGSLRAGGGGGPEVHVHIHTDGKDGEKVAAELKSSGVLDQILDAITDALRTGGNGTPSYG